MEFRRTPAYVRHIVVGGGSFRKKSPSIIWNSINIFTKKVCTISVQSHHLKGESMTLSTAATAKIQVKFVEACRRFKIIGNSIRLVRRQKWRWNSNVYQSHSRCLEVLTPSTCNCRPIALLPSDHNDGSRAKLIGCASTADRHGMSAGSVSPLFVVWTTLRTR